MISANTFNKLAFCLPRSHVDKRMLAMPPRKTVGSLVGIKGEREIYQLVPPSWSIGKHDQDYGVDFDLEIWTEDREPEFFARNVAIQVKSRETFRNLEFSDHEKYHSFALPEISNCPKTRIKKSTLEYLAKTNSFLFHICHDYDVRRFPHFQGFFDLFDADARQFMMINLNSLCQNNSPLVSVIPLRPIFEIAKDFDQQTSSIPLLPQSYHFLPPIELDENFNEPKRIWTRDPYRFSKHIDFDKNLFLSSWKECTTLGVKSKSFLELINISFLGHMGKNTSEILKASVLENSGAWLMVETFVSTYASARSPDDFRWIERHISSDSAFINFLAMRCCRKHQVSLTKGFLRYCRSGFPHSKTTLHNDPYDSQRGNSFLRRFFDEAIYYFSDLTKKDPHSARALLHVMLNADHDMKYSLGYFFGSFERHKNLEKDLLMFCLSEMRKSPPLQDEKRKGLRRELIRYLNSFAIQWFLLDGKCL